MKSVTRDVAIIGVVVLGLVLGLATQGQAVALRFVTPVFTADCEDGAMCDGNPALNAVMATAVFSGTTFTGTGILAETMMLESSIIGGVATASYGLSFTVTDLTGGPFVFDTLLTGTQSGPGPKPPTTGFKLTGNLGNAPFNGSTICSSSGTGNFGPKSCTTAPFGGALFSLTEVIQITGAVTASAKAVVTAQANNKVPEPATLLLLGSGLAAAGLWSGGRRTLRGRRGKDIA